MASRNQGDRKLFRRVLPTSVSLTLFGLIFGALAPASAAPEPAKWTSVNLPTTGETGGWVLAPGSDVKHLTMAKDGALYAYANPAGTGNTLFRSSDSGVNWGSVGEVRDAIVAIATVPDDANVVYYATASNVYKSADAAKTFSPLPPTPGGSGSDNITITSLDVTRLGGRNVVAVGAADSDGGQFGGVYILDEGKLIPAWENTAAGAFDIRAVAFSPNYPTDRQLLAAGTDESDTLVISKTGAGGWNQFSGRAVIAGRAARAAALAFPDGYDGSQDGYTFFAAFDTGANTGDVYRVTGHPDESTADDLNAGSAYNLADVDISSLAVSGNSSAARLLAGAGGSAQVYASVDGGATWTRSKKQPTGQSVDSLLMAPDFARTGIAYAATSGPDSAFSRTVDGGVSWNQVGLIDTAIGSLPSTALGVSPDFARDQTLFMITFGGAPAKHSLWRSRNAGETWERVFSAPAAGSLKLVRLSPTYNKTAPTVFLTGDSNGIPAVWKSADDGQTFALKGAPLPVDVWEIVDDNRLLLGSFNGSSALVFNTANSGFFYSNGTAAGSQSLKSLAVSPDFERDGAVLAGNSAGWVYFSSDNGTSFKPLPRDAASPPLTGSVTVAFDPGFAANKTVYAADSAANKGVYRFVIGKSTTWERTDTTLPASGAAVQLAASSNATLYAVNSQGVNSATNKGGIERSIDPAGNPATFETVTRGLADGATLDGLWVSGNQLWSVDTTNTRVMTFVDSVASPAALTSPADNAANTGNSNVVLKWAGLGGATEYRWQLSYDSDFSTNVSGGDTKALSARLQPLDPDTTYYWRVRAVKPVLSPWSAARSFGTGSGMVSAAPELYSPEAGAKGVPVNPLFQWSSVSGADSYELVVSTNVSLSNPAILRTGPESLPATAWQAEASLDPGRAYYWKVRGRSATAFSAWSPVGAFITALPPSSSPSPAVQPEQTPNNPGLPAETVTPSSPPTTPAPPPAQTALQPQSALPAWFPYLMAVLVLAMIGLLIAVLLLVLKMRRS